MSLSKNEVLRLMTIDEVAEILNVKPSLIRALILRREIPFRKVGRLIRFDRAELEQWQTSSDKYS